MRKTHQKEYYPIPVQTVGMSLPVTVGIEGTAHAGRTERIEHIDVGDTIILKSDWNSPYYWPVAIEVFNENKETLGFLQDDGTNRLAQLATQLDILHASVASVTPLSKRKRNAKYALLDVAISINTSDLSPQKQRKSSELMKQVQVAEEKRRKNQEKRNAILMDLWQQKTGFPIRASLNSIRKTRVDNLHIGDSVFVTYSSDRLQALNECHEIIGSFNCLPSFHEADRLPYNDFTMAGRR